MAAVEVGLMDQEAVILEILQAVGVYDKARERVSSDAELARMFVQDFGELIQLVSNGTASEGSSPGRP